MDRKEVELHMLARGTCAKAQRWERTHRYSRTRAIEILGDDGRSVLEMSLPDLLCFLFSTWMKISTPHPPHVTEYHLLRLF